MKINDDLTRVVLVMGVGKNGWERISNQSWLRNKGAPAHKINQDYNPEYIYMSKANKPVT